MAESTSSQNLPSTSSQNLPSTSSQNLPSTSKQPSHEEIRLETHIWHAKHFHMISKWKHQIPYYLINNSLTASYKAITQNCLLQDISYYTCIEIVGQKNLLEATLMKHCNPRKTLASKMYTNGQKEGMIMFFKKNGYPQFPIGNVNFFWKLSETDIKTIWIWVHPAFYSDFLSEIISSFEFKQNNAEQDRTDISYNLNDLYTNDAGCEMRVLKYALNRFRLSGPAALTVLDKALYVPSLTELDLDSENCPTTEEQDSSSIDEKLDTSTGINVSLRSLRKMVIDEKATKDSTIQDLKKKVWNTKYYKERENIEAFKVQEQMWQSMKVLGSPRFLPSNMIIGLTVSEPRFYLPRRKIKVPLYAENLRCQLPADLIRSPIWDAQIRQIVSDSCVYKNMMELILIATSGYPYFNKNAKIPILLIQKPAVASLGLGSSIDIIIPSRWAMIFWIALIIQSVSVGGLRETELVVLESLGPYVPDINDPDTPAYMREASTRKKELTNEYFSHSAIERVNFIQFGIHSPFFCDWKNLTNDWSNVEDFYVLRHLRLLALLRTKIKIIGRKNARSTSSVQEFDFDEFDFDEFDFDEFDEYQNCLVQVKLSIVNKGTPKDFAIICIPKHKDLRRLKNNENYDGPIEICHTDPNIYSRKLLHRVHVIQLEQLSQQLSRGFKQKETFQDNVVLEKYDAIHDTIDPARFPKHYKMMSDQAEEMKKLYFPESMEVRHSCDREVMGYVTIGGHSFLRRKGIGIGYVTLPSLLQIIRQNSNIVLVRNNTELEYRFARLKILVDKYA